MNPIFSPVKKRLVFAFHPWAGLSDTTFNVIAINTRLSYTAATMNGREMISGAASTAQYCVGPI